MQRKTSLYVALLLSLFAQAAYPQELGLKLEEELQPGREADENAPLFVDADRIRGRQEREIEASGNVRLRRTGEAIFADYLRYDFTTQEVVARGNLRFEREGVVVTGVGLRFNLVDSTGEIEEVDYFLTEIGAHGEADRLIAQGKTDDAISQYMDMAETYYRLADLDMSRETYANALRLSQRCRYWPMRIIPARTSRWIGRSSSEASLPSTAIVIRTSI